jgi:hypothetical protein
MQNFVFKTRNPEYSWWVAGGIFVTWVGYDTSLNFKKFMSSLQFSTPMIFWFSIFIGLAICSLLFISKIKVDDKIITIKKSFIIFVYYKYEWEFEKIEFSKYADSVEFINKNNEVLHFYEDTYDGWEDGMDEFMMRISTNNRIILGYNDFTKFKESLAEWNKKI